MYTGKRPTQKAGRQIEFGEIDITMLDHNPNTYRYGYVRSSPNLAIRVEHAPRDTFRILEADRTQGPNPSVWIVSRRDPSRRIKRTVPQPHGEDDSLMEADEWFVSPDERYLLADQKIMRGVNGITLYERVGHTGLRYRPALRTFLSALAADCAVAASVRRGRTYGEWLTKYYFFRPIGWHGRGDRYMDFEFEVDHGPLVWRGSYDTVRHRFREDVPPIFGPNGPRAFGEKFPQTRTRLLTAAEITHWNYAQVRYAVNEIYARYGYSFHYEPPSIWRQFARFDWYRQDWSFYSPTEIVPHMTTIERTNLPALIRHRDALYKAGRAN